MTTLNFNVINEGSLKTPTNGIDTLRTSEDLPSPLQMEGSISSSNRNIPSPQAIVEGAAESSIEDFAPQPESFGGSLSESIASSPSPQMDAANASSSGTENEPTPMDIEELDNKPAVVKPKTRASKSKTTRK
tara:strand:- start:942 stop:1337 length:396 start_codon:yes stop_codon:yes gene_type:complete